MSPSSSRRRSSRRRRRRHARKRRHGLRGLLALVAAIAATVGIAGPAASRPPETAITASEFVDLLSGPGVDTADLVVYGDVDLAGVRVVDRLLRCRQCTVVGDLRAVDVTFERDVDLSGIRIAGDLDMHGASFLDVVTFGGEGGGRARVEGRTDLSQATFGGLVSLDHVAFMGPLDASNVTSASAMSLSHAEVDGAVTFEHAQLGGAFISSDASFAGPVSFTLANFAAAALFRGARFEDGASYRSAAFDERVDFSSARFEGPASFEDVVLEGPGIFRRINVSDRFSWEQSFAQSLDFNGAAFVSGATFTGISTSGVLSLDNVTVIPDSGLVMSAMSPAGVRLEVAQVGQIAGRATRIRALRLLEATAEADGDLALANDARYALLSLQRDPSGLDHWVDSVLYRGVAGYLVRPLHPLLTLAALVLVGGIARASTRADRPLRIFDPTLGVEPRAGRRRPSRTAVIGAGHAVVVGAHEALRRAGRLRLGREAGETEPLTLRSALLGLESIVYTLLIVVAVLALSNSSSTLREVIDAVRG